MTTSQWVIKWRPGMVCHHWSSKRQGTAMKIQHDSEFMTIVFDDTQQIGVPGWGGVEDGRVETRRKSAFIAGPNDLRSESKM